MKKGSCNWGWERFLSDCSDFLHGRIFLVEVFSPGLKFFSTVILVFKLPFNLAVISQQFLCVLLSKLRIQYMFILFQVMLFAEIWCVFLLQVLWKFASSG